MYRKFLKVKIMRKTFLLVMLISAVVSISSYGQSVRIERITVKSDSSDFCGISESSSEKRRDSTVRKDNIDEILKSHALAFGLESLKSRSVSEDITEILFWGSREVTLYCLVLKLDPHKSSASLYSGNLMNGVVAKNSITSRDFGNPHSGWSEISDYLQKQSIALPLPFFLDKSEPDFRDPDEGDVILEMKKGKEYGLVYYRKFTETKDGKSVIRVCKKLEDEFNIAIGCN